MSTVPTITVRQLGTLIQNSVNTVSISVIDTLGVLIGMAVQNIGQMTVNQQLTIDTGANQEVVTTVNVYPSGRTFDAVFLRTHLTGVTVVGGSPSNYEPLFGNGKNNFISDLQAVAQIVLTRLRLFEGEWWAAQNDGLPLWQNILAASASARSQQQIELLISNRITGTPYVNGVSNVQVGYNSTSRAFTYYAVVQTQFGQLVVSNYPTPQSQTLPV
jgi:hypothetical protein